MYDKIQYRQLNTFAHEYLQRMAIQGSVVLSKYDLIESNISFDTYFDHALNALVLQIHYNLMGKCHETVFIDRKWPADWWQAFKERWFPKWLVKKFPVKYDSVYVNRPVVWNVCPHLKTEGAGTHVKYCIEKVEENRPQQARAGGSVQEGVDQVEHMLGVAWVYEQ